MAKVPLPERGQPIDVTYVSQITNAINDLSDRIVTKGYNFTTILGKDIRTSDVRIIATTLDVSSGSAETAEGVREFQLGFSKNFSSTPVATATILNNGETDAGNAATVVLTDVNANGLEGLVRFQKTGNVTAKVNIIVVGIPF
jgi:hypothetical protein